MSLMLRGLSEGESVISVKSILPSYCFWDRKNDDGLAHYEPGILEFRFRFNQGAPHPRVDGS